MAEIPKFHNEQEESDFWDTHSTTDFFDETEKIPLRVVDARPKTLISLRLEQDTIERLKMIARSKGLGYQTLIRMWLMERLTTEAMSETTE